MILTHRLGIWTILVLICLSYSNVSPFDYTTSILTMQDKTPTIFLLTSSAPQKPKPKSNHIFQFHKAAELFYSKHPQKSPGNSQLAQDRLLFVVSDPNDGLFTFDRLAEYLGIREEDAPAIVYLSGSHQKYLFKNNGSKIRSKDIVKFLEDISAGKVPIFYKSEPQQPNQKGKEGFVKKVVGSKFDKTILSSQKQCMVLFYSPLLYNSRALKVQFEKAAQSLRKNRNIAFYKVDATKNQVLLPSSSQDLHPLLVKQENAPLIVLFPKNKQSPPITYSAIKEYEYSYDFMLKWLKERTEYPWIRSEEVSDQIFQQL